jgi:hypothetical protein
MEGVSKSPKRRTLLQRGLVLLTGALGLGTVARRVESAAAPAPKTDPTLRLHGRRGQAPSRLPGRSGERLVRYGELLDGPDGKRIGQFFTSGFCLETPFGPQPAAASNLEFQTFQLPEGTLFGIGAAGAGAERTLAILGGTGRFAAVRGSYVEREVPSRTPGRDAVEFVVSLSS